MYPLKWGKRDYMLNIDNDATPSSIMMQVQNITGVPITNQKLMAKKGWKGVLGEKTKLKVKPGKTTISLMGSATETIAATIKTKTKNITFTEDIDPKQLEELERIENEKLLLLAEGNIPSIQLFPTRRDDGKAITYRYNYFVTGEPQKLIEDMLSKQRESERKQLEGKVCMTFGVELGKAYTTKVDVFPSGTLISARDDGKLQFWRQGNRVCEVCQDKYAQQPEPITCLAVVDDRCVAGGSGMLKVYSGDGEVLQELGSPNGTNPNQITPIGGGFAVTFRQARPFDPNQFRLVPQNEAQVARRQEAIEERQRQEERYHRISTGITIIEGQNGHVYTKNYNLYPWESRMTGHVPSITSLAFIPNEQSLVAGDSEGSIRVWLKNPLQGGFNPRKLIQLQLSSNFNELGVAVIGIETMKTKSSVLAVATAPITVDPDLPPGRLISSQINCLLTVPKPGVVLMIDINLETVLCSLDGHSDLVRVMCSLPNGDLLTAGGKSDAKCKIWNVKQYISGGIEEENEAEELQRALALSQGEQKVANVAAIGDVLVGDHHAKEIKPGYVFDACVLPDLKSGSECYALAVARYNTISVSL